MQAVGRFPILMATSILLVACSGGGNGKPQQVKPPDPPAAPVATVDADIKQLIFSWDVVSGATHYRLLENPDGHSGFTQTGDDISSGTLSSTKNIAVHLHDWANALYMVQACNTAGCTGSSEISASELMLSAIGYFKASNSEFNDHFGYWNSVALSADGRVLAVGAHGEDSAATGLNGDQSDNSTENAGAVYVFRASSAGWTQDVYLKAANSSYYDNFGVALHLNSDGTRLLVNSSSGAHVFDFNGEDWIQTAFFTEKGALDLSTDGNLLAVRVNGEVCGVAKLYFQSVLLYRFNGDNWVQEGCVSESNARRGDRFASGGAFSADGSVLVVAAAGDSSSGSGINSDPIYDPPAGQSGAVYVYRFDGVAWTKEAYVKASNPDRLDKFGGSVAVSADGNTFIVGAYGESSMATGINGDQSDNLGHDSGAAYLFRFDGVNWNQEAYIKASNTFWEPANPVVAHFGQSVAISADGNTLAVGADGETSSSMGINGDQTAENTYQCRAGAAYVFAYDGESWEQIAYVKAPYNDCGGDRFGVSAVLSADGTTLAIGAYAEDSNADGIGGDMADSSADDSGAVYVY